MSKQTQHRQVGDTRIAIAAQLKRPDGSVVDLTGLTVKFEMFNSKDGTAKVSETSDNVTVTDAANGKVKYSPQSADVDTEGTYHAYFTVYSGSDYEHFPARGGYFRIQIHDEV